MISVQEAQRLIKRYTPSCKKELVEISKSLGLVLAEDIKATVSLPSYNNSAMDGYVLRMRENRSFKIKGTIQAGDIAKKRLAVGEAYQIMTGGMIPQGGEVVVPKEEAILKKGSLFVRNRLKKGNHIRKEGEEIRKGKKLVVKNTVIHPGLIASLASMGKKEIRVYQKPTVSLITTGSELIPVGGKLKKGQIYDSNSAMILSALDQMKVGAEFVRTVQDNPKILLRVVNQALEISDIVILMGGVSVGEYDYVKEVLSQLKVKEIFWRIKQKPGKPLYFGKKGKQLIFGLPGNPASVFTCFYEYVYPAIRRMMGYVDPYLKEENAFLTDAVKLDPAKVRFLKGKRLVSPNNEKRQVAPLGFQGSHMITSLIESDCFIVIPPGKGILKKGSKVALHSLP